MRWADGFAETALYELDQVGAGHSISGPAIVESVATTFTIPPGRAAQARPPRDLPPDRRGRGVSAFTDERLASVGDVELAYQTMGDSADEPMLLVMGLASQMIGWPDAFCSLLVERGFFVIRFDNRDCGRSSVLDDGGAPSPRDALEGGADAVPYTLSDLAGDAAGLLDALDVAAAHLVGVSMGGMIAQTLAIEHRERVRSLASIMSTTGDPSVGGATPEAQEVLWRRPPLDDREAFAEEVVEVRAVIGSQGLERDEDWSRETGRRAFDRGIYPDGSMRQIAAIVASGDRTEALGRLDVPTVVVHGTDDALISVTGGEATAAAIPGAELVLIDGMGHDLPPAAWDRIVEAIVANAARAAVPYGSTLPPRRRRSPGSVRDRAGRRTPASHRRRA